MSTTLLNIADFHVRKLLARKHTEGMDLFHQDDWNFFFRSSNGHEIRVHIEMDKNVTIYWKGKFLAQIPTKPIDGVSYYDQKTLIAKFC